MQPYSKSVSYILAQVETVDNFDGKCNVLVSSYCT